MSSNWNDVPQSPGIAVNQMDPSADQNATPPTVSHPVLSSKAALEYAKNFDTDASRAVYHRQGPGGEPGFTIFNKKGGSSFIPVSSIAKNNPAVVLGDNLHHSTTVGGNDDQTQTRQPVRQQQPTTNAPGPNDQVPASNKTQTQAPQSEDDTGGYKVGDKVRLAPGNAGPVYTITGQSGFKYQAWDPLNRQTIELPQTQDQIDRENLFKTGRTGMSAGDVQNLSNDQVQKLTKQYTGPIFGEHGESDQANAFYSTLSTQGRTLDDFYGLQRDQPLQYGQTMDVMKYMNDKLIADQTPSYEGWLKDNGLTDSKDLQARYQNAQRMNSSLQATAAQIIQYANALNKDPIAELRAAGFNALTKTDTEQEQSQGHLSIPIVNVSGNKLKSSTTGDTISALSFDVNNLDRLKAYYQLVATQYKNKAQDWVHSGMDLSPHAKNDIDALSGRNGRVLDPGSDAPKWVPWELKPDQQKPSESSWQSKTNTPSSREKRYQESWKHFWDPTWDSSKGSSSSAPASSNTPTPVNIDHLTLPEQKVAFTNAPDGTYFTMNGHTVRKRGTGWVTVSTATA